MKKIFLMLIMILLLTGCSAEYDITFSKDLSVEESLIATEDDEFFKGYPNSSYQRVIGFILEPNLDYLNNNNYTNEIVNNMSSKGVKIDNKFDSISDLKEISKIYLQAVDEIKYEKIGNKIRLSAIVSINTNEQDQEKYYVENLKLNIKVPFYVTESNADSIDEENNVYTWNFSKDNNSREVIFEFDKKRLKINYLPYIIIGVGLIVILPVAIYFISKIIKRNKINEI